MSDEKQHLVLQVGGWAWGQQPHTGLQDLVTETAKTQTTRIRGPIGDSSQPTGTMTAPDESPSLELRSLNKSFLGPRTTIRLGTWNVCTMFETSKTAQVIKVMQNYKLDILGESEFCRWTGSGRN